MSVLSHRAALAGIAVLSCPAWVAGQNAESEIRRVEAQYERLQTHKDTAAMRRLLDDSFIEVDHHGNVLDKTRRLAGYASNNLVFETVARDDVQVRAYGSTAIFTARSHSTGTDNRTSDPARRHFDVWHPLTHVWVKSDDVWRLVSEHNSDIDMRPPGAAARTIYIGMRSAGNVRDAKTADPVALTPDDYTVLFENERVRVLDWHMGAGHREPMHVHPDNVVYTFSQYRLRMLAPDGRATELESKPGTAFLMGATTHAPENIGTSEAHALQVELKEAMSLGGQPGKPTEDLLVGTWVTDTSRSTAAPGPMRFTRWTSRVERTPDGYRVVGDGVRLPNVVVHSEALWRFDGKEAMIAGDDPPATYTWRRIDELTFEALRKDANGTITSRTVISPDGSMRVNFHTRRNAHGAIIQTVFEVMSKR